jgi:glutamyl-tRNA synthetase
VSEKITRLAPSPTGALHLGNARTFLINYLLARTRHWKVLMRVEDLDGPRVKPHATEEAMADLRWLGLEWEQPVVYQSQRASVYAAALKKLIADGAVYPCTCSRKDIELASSAPHRDDGQGSYRGTCRTRWSSPEEAQRITERPLAWRVKVRDETVCFDDRLAGPQRFNLARTCGDFVVYRNEGLASYQLAVVLDDTDADVNRIVRGDDLLESAGRQIHLRRTLGISDGADEPEYWHVPLVVGTDGRRLAKRHGDTRLAHYRSAGISPQRILGLLGYWSGSLKTPRETSIDELLDRFVPERIPSQPVVFTEADEAFLRGSGQ